MDKVSLSPSNSNSQLITDNWFNEINTFWPGQKFSLEIEEILENGKSKFQDILVFKSKSYGKVLVLDGVI
jgi:spermidine synthase